MRIKVFTDLIADKHYETSMPMSAEDRMEEWRIKMLDKDITIIDIDYSIRDAEMKGYIYTRTVIVVKYKYNNE
jgi:hypothetical protein